ncbi:uncharacterized protein LOC124185185 [Neodiprion fabricii]|uniref:uncharacterized protein LOC124185185 n=1 Tax=Neodiprion fabricii TaxID=2872261 RepID=UPI001ED9158B|nr:uncharacterized protein LOC124185185 [Neodiprion fabricii]
MDPRVERGQAINTWASVNSKRKVAAYILRVMWRGATFTCCKIGILHSRKMILGQFPRKLRAVRVLLSKDCYAPIQCPEQCKSTCLMDELPVPCGSWQQKFDTKMRQSNRALMIGGGFFIFTIIAMHKFGYVRGYNVPLFY